MPETKVIEDLRLAAQSLREGQLVAFPTETVYGLGVDATNSQAVERLFAAKGRPADNPLIVHLANINLWPLAARELPAMAEVLLEAFSPGPLTVVVPKLAEISPLVTAGLDTIGLRIPAQPTAAELLGLCQLPIAAPSANRSGRPSCTTWQAVLEDLDGHIDFILKGDDCQVGLESTVVDCTSDRPIILRSGGISFAQIQSVIPSTVTVAMLAKSSATAFSKASPGTRHAHYQPNATVTIFEKRTELGAIATPRRAESAAAWLKAESPTDHSERFNGFALVHEFDSVESFARGFYEFLREADRRGLKQVFIELVADDQLGTALRDRQLRAAGRKSAL